MDLIIKNTDSLRLPVSNLCRCCLKGGCCKDISVQCYDYGEKEIYSELLKNTFNIQIIPDNSTMICDSCITRVKDASSFKQMVLRSLRSFKEYMESVEYGNNFVKCDTDTKQMPIKLENEQDIGSVNDDCDDGVDSGSEDEILANIKLELAARSHTGRDRRKIKPSNLKRCKIKAEKEAEHNKPKLTERRGTAPILRDNSLKLLANSTICIFQWHKSRYRCFCCNEPFTDIGLLRTHTKTHTLQEIEKKIIRQQNRLVKAEVSVLKCSICENSCDNLTGLRTHLTHKHSVTFDLSEDLLVPFKICDSLKCQICFEEFTVFRHLNIHMNKHFQKQVCHTCGAGFSNLAFLNLHRYRSHRPLICKLCDVGFMNNTEKRHHEVTVHSIKLVKRKRYPCSYCPERFTQENLRVRHLVATHNIKQPEFKCNLCPKVYITKSLYNNHLKTVHFKERVHECDVCHNFFYTKYDLKRHKVTHSGEKKYSCVVCLNVFATKDTLRRHMKRTHGT